MTAKPAALASTTPVVSTVATDGSLDVQVTVADEGRPEASVTSATKSTLLPTTSCPGPTMLTVRTADPRPR